MNICVLGGGNIGTVLLGDLAARKNIPSIYLLENLRYGAEK